MLSLGTALRGPGLLVWVSGVSDALLGSGGNSLSPTGPSSSPERAWASCNPRGDPGRVRATPSLVTQVGRPVGQGYRILGPRVESPGNARWICKPLA